MPWIDVEEHPDFNLTEEEARGLASTGSGHGVVVVAVAPTEVALTKPARDTIGAT
jgi:hypothetical protein